MTQIHAWGGGANWGATHYCMFYIRILVTKADMFDTHIFDGQMD